MPTFSPTIAFVATGGSFSWRRPSASHADAPPGQRRAERSVQLCRGVSLERTPTDIDWRGTGQYNSPSPPSPLRCRSMIDHAPPPVPFGQMAAVAVDVERVGAAITFDASERQATVTASVEFAVGATSGCPVLDLRQ